MYLGHPNLAVGKPAWQSSTLPQRSATQAVDGKRDGDFSEPSCSLTDVDEVPWWAVDLQAEAEIGYVAITNGGDQGRIYSVSYLISFVNFLAAQFWWECSILCMISRLLIL